MRAIPNVAAPRLTWKGSTFPKANALGYRNFAAPPLASRTGASPPPVAASLRGLRAVPRRRESGGRRVASLARGLRRVTGGEAHHRVCRAFCRRGRGRGGGGCTLARGSRERVGGRFGGGWRRGDRRRGRLGSLPARRHPPPRRADTRRRRRRA